LPGRTKATSELLSLLGTGSPSEIADALNALAGRAATLRPAERERVVVSARAGLDSPSADVRGQAMFALGELGEDPSLFERGLADSDWFVRLAAVNALARLATPIPIAAIKPLLSDPEPLVRDAVEQALDERDASGSLKSPKPASQPKQQRTGWIKWRPWLWQEVSWEDWSTQELAMLRADLLHRNPWNNFIVVTAVFATAIAVISVLAHAPIGEAIVMAIAMTLALAPLWWVRYWKSLHGKRYLPNRFDVLEFLAVTGWGVLMLVILVTLSRAFKGS
jgi:hypothetical protein